VKPAYLVSACLAGESCRYDGSSCKNEWVAALILRGEAVGFCPEIEGGLGVPRERCELCEEPGGATRVISASGRDVTEYFLRGARKAVELVVKHGIGAAVLKSRSPSCGFGRIYDGSFSGRLVDGMGVTARLLREMGVCLYTEGDVPALLT
jgi:uncharacterized protein YbbK (DUF523 family)